MTARLLFLISAGVALTGGGVAASAPAPKTDCDIYAASPSDPNRQADGVSLENLNADLAVLACQSAVQAYPESDRLILQLGRAYYKNNDLANAFTQFEKAAQNGYAMAQYDVAASYEQGSGVKRDYAQALIWYRRAAEQGILAAQVNLGRMYLLGEGINQNSIEAVRWLRKAADRGDAQAQYLLGYVYESGSGVAASHAEAERWYGLAAKQGYPVAQAKLTAPIVKSPQVDDRITPPIRKPNWKTLTADNGAVYRIDLNSISGRPDWAAAIIYIDEGGPFNPMNQKFVSFDCHGHMNDLSGRGIVTTYVPPLSIGGQLSNIACAAISRRQ